MIRMENDGNSLSGGNVTGQGNPRSSVSLLDNKTSSISWTNDVRVRAVSSVLEEIFTWSTISQWFYFLLFEPNLKLAAPPNLIKIQPRVKNSSSFQRHVSRATKLSLSLSLQYHPTWNIRRIEHGINLDSTILRALACVYDRFTCPHGRCTGGRVCVRITLWLFECVNRSVSAEDAREGSASRGNDWSFLLFANCTGKGRRSPVQDIRHLIWFLDYAAAWAERNTLVLDLPLCSLFPPFPPSRPFFILFSPLKIIPCCVTLLWVARRI